MISATPQSFDIPPLLDRPIDYTYLVQWCIEKGYRYPRNKISRLIKKGQLAQLRRGLYCVARGYGGQMDPVIAAGSLYGPSYVSYQYALSHWGLIPEQVRAVTSATTRRPAQFVTPIGMFTYAHVRPESFPYGLVFETAGDLQYLLATPEKALLDMMHSVRSITRVSDISAWLFDDLRVYEEAFYQLDLPQLIAVARYYHSRSTAALSRWIETKVLGKRQDVKL